MTQKSRQVMPSPAESVLIGTRSLTQQRVLSCLVSSWRLQREEAAQSLLQDNVRTVQIASRAGLVGCGQLMTMFHWEEGPSSSWKPVEGGRLTLGCVRARPANED